MTIAQCADRAAKLFRNGKPMRVAIRIASTEGFTAERVIRKELSRRAKAAKAAKKKAAKQLTFPTILKAAA